MGQMPRCGFHTRVTVQMAHMLSCTSEWKHVLLQYHKHWVFSHNNNKKHIPVFPEKFYSKVEKSPCPPLPEPTCPGGVHTVASLLDFTRSCWESCECPHHSVISAVPGGDFKPPHHSPSRRYCFTNDRYFRFCFFPSFQRLPFVWKLNLQKMLRKPSR